MKLVVFAAATLLTLAATAAVAAMPPDGVPPGFAMPGIRVRALDLSTVPGPKISSGQAFDSARGYWQWPAEAKVTAWPVLFSDDDLVDLGGGSLIRNRPAWLLAVTGIDYYGRGPTSDVNHEINIVVDAANGKVLEQFSYR